MLNDSDGRHQQGEVREATLDDGGLMVYDTANEEAWIQTDAAVNLSEHG